MATPPDNPTTDYDLQDRLIDLAVRISTVCDGLPSTRVAKHVAVQLVRCGTAPAPLHAEASAAESRKDFVHKLRLCLKELRETMTWLRYLQRLGIGEQQAGIFTIFLMGAQGLGALTMGYLGDRIGFRKVLFIVGLLFLVCVTLSMLSHSLILFYVVFFLLGFFYMGFTISNINYLYALCPHEDKSLYLALNATLALPLSASLPILSGIVAQNWGIERLLPMAGGLVILALVLLVRPQGLLSGWRR